MIDSSEGITTCLHCLGNVACDLDGKPHEHNCDSTKQTLHKKHQVLTQLYNCAGVPTKEGSDERHHQERRLLHCPVCNRDHYHIAMCKDRSQNIKNGLVGTNIHVCFEPAHFVVVVKRKKRMCQTCCIGFEVKDIHFRLSSFIENQERSPVSSSGTNGEVALPKY
jgi:hypothetical protein